MTNQIETTRFGLIAMTSEHLIRFRDGMVGFPHLKNYILVESPSVPLLLWLQSTENPAVAFPVVEPWFFHKSYRPSPTSAEVASLELQGKDRTKVFVVLTIPPEMPRMTVNLKAPVVINLDRGLAVQMVLSDKNFEIRVPAFEAFSKAVAAFTLPRGSDDELQSPSGHADFDAWNPVAFRSVSGGGAELRVS